MLKIKSSGLESMVQIEFAVQGIVFWVEARALEYRFVDRSAWQGLANALAEAA